MLEIQADRQTEGQTNGQTDKQLKFSTSGTGIFLFNYKVHLQTPLQEAVVAEDKRCVLSSTAPSSSAIEYGVPILSFDRVLLY